MHTIVALVLGLSVLQAGEPGREALNLGRTHDQALYDAFNAGYKLATSGIIDSAELITEFRRAVLIVRDHASQGEYSFTEQQLAQALTPYRGLVTIAVSVRLNPQNTFLKPPAYDLYIRTSRTTKPLPADKFTRQPVYPVPGIIPPGTAMSGIKLEGTFSVADISNASDPYIIVADENGNPIWEARLDLTRFR